MEFLKFLAGLIAVMFILFIGSHFVGARPYVQIDKGAVYQSSGVPQ